VQRLSEKMQFTQFLFLHVMPKHELGELGKNTHFDCLLSQLHVCLPNCLNQFTYVKIVARRSFDVLDSVYLYQVLFLSII